MNTSQSLQLLQTLDRLIGEMNLLRVQVAGLETPTRPRSVRQAAYVGMWADRDDLPTSASSREWLEQWRRQQWQR